MSYHPGFVMLKLLVMLIIINCGVGCRFAMGQLNCSYKNSNDEIPTPRGSMVVW